MKILVTGSAGFIGARLCEGLKEEGYFVRGFDRISVREGYADEHIVGDLLEPEQVDYAVSGTDAVFHLAAIANVNYAREHSLETVKVNVMGTSNVCEACKKYHVPIYYASTCCVYGNTSAHPTHEEAPLKPTEIYGCTKLAGEYVILGYNRLFGVPFNIMRYSTVYGKGMRKELAVFIFLEKAIRGEPIPIDGSGKQTRSFIYIGDLIEANISLLKSGVMNEIFNMAGREEVSVLEVAGEALRLAGDPNNRLFFREDRLGQVMKEQIDISKIRGTIGWEPKVGFKLGMKNTFNWIREMI
ncbi:MAG: NAD-dependent epimerase/dehydratase family protein [archaeon]|nr:NAD-dependent epimerase/dehydratase family protein [archaeon]MCP8305844.1 NAD-dependent epimerase/dehydratase family protein [archaeon]